MIWINLRKRATSTGSGRPASYQKRVVQPRARR